MGTKLISLNMKLSAELPELEDLRTFLATDLSRHLSGFTPLDTDVQWGDTPLSLIGRDASGALVAVFASVAQQERDLHDVMTQALLAAAWLDENGDEVAQQYGSSDVNIAQPLKMVLVAPSLATVSRPLSRALAKAGLHVMRYSIYDIDTSDEVLRGVSFDDGAGDRVAPVRDPVPPRSRESDGNGRPSTRAPEKAASLEKAASAPARRAVESPAPPSPTAPDAPRVEGAPKTAAPETPAKAAAHAAPDAPQKPARRPPAEMFLLSMSGAMQAMAERVLKFLMERFPDAVGEIKGTNAFTLAVERQHVATVHVDRSSLWLEVGPDRIPTNKITDLAMLELVMTLPSVLNALGAGQRA